MMAGSFISIPLGGVSQAAACDGNHFEIALTTTICFSFPESYHCKCWTIGLFILNIRDLKYYSVCKLFSIIVFRHVVLISGNVNQKWIVDPFWNNHRNKYCKKIVWKKKRVRGKNHFGQLDAQSLMFIDHVLVFSNHADHQFACHSNY